MRFVAIGLLLLALSFRFIHLDHKVYWFDETFTSLRVAGYTETEVVQHLRQSSIVPLSELQHFQQFNPDRTLTDTLHSLAAEDPQHPPLYYILARFWMQIFGSSVLAMRALPATLSLMALPAAYWLGWELFVATSALKTTTAAWVATALIAVSPFQVLYAQEAREYSLWGALILLSTAALLRALRLSTLRAWGLYAALLAASFYCFLLSGLVAVAHVLYVAIVSRWRRQVVLWEWAATLTATGVFLPWLAVVAWQAAQVERVTKWTTSQRSIANLGAHWLSMLGHIFYDTDERWPELGIHLLLLGLAVYALFHLCRQTPRCVWLMIVLLVALPILVMLLPDLLLGGSRSVTARYLLPLWLGIQFAVAYLLAYQLEQAAGKQQLFWRSLTAIVLTLGIVSFAVGLPAKTWWSKALSKDIPAIAHLIDRTPHPLIVSDAQLADLFSLGHKLHTDADLLLRPRCYTCRIYLPGKAPQLLAELPAQFSQNRRDVFVFRPRASQEWYESLQENQPYRLEPMDVPGLWRVLVP